MKTFNWNVEKNRLLKQERSISFEEVVFHLEAGDAIDIFDHPNQARYPGQKIYAVVIEDYVYLVPFVRIRRRGVSQDDHPQPEGEETVWSRFQWLS